MLVNIPAPWSIWVASYSHDPGEIIGHVGHVGRLEGHARTQTAGHGDGNLPIGNLGSLGSLRDGVPFMGMSR